MGSCFGLLYGAWRPPKRGAAAKLPKPDKAALVASLKDAVKDEPQDSSFPVDDACCRRYWRARATMMPSTNLLPRTLAPLPVSRRETYPASLELS